jgi:hypothetical protein
MLLNNTKHNICICYCSSYAISLLGPTLRRSWNCTSAFPLCLHKYAMGWPLPLLPLPSTLTPTRIYWQILSPSNVV